MTNGVPPPSPSDQFFDSLRQHIAEVHWRWRMFLDLFERSGTRVAAMDRRTGIVFGCFRVALADSIVLEIAKLFDPKVMGRGKYERHPVSLYGAVEVELGLEKDDERRRKLLEELEELAAQCGPIIRHRHRRIAHNDRLVSARTEVLPGVMRQDVERALKGIAAVFDQMSRIRSKTQTDFGIPFHQEKWQIDALFELLEIGNAAKDATAEED